VQYGLSLPNFGEFFSPRRLADLAREAEAAGWDGFFLWDHVLAWPVPMVDPWIALTAIAMSTQRMRIGPMVTPLPRRRPVKLAREAVSLDHLSEGRLILGVGIGQGTWEWDNLGEEIDLHERGEMLASRCYATARAARPTALCPGIAGESLRMRRYWR
jgi:alkanesulfonate monooxygenase SsuD/methylene tetrahydromethanopterin reductase-like flavin-dependent oxidoreductase (luciferase family)